MDTVDTKKCIKCGKTFPASQSLMLSNDPDMCTTLCKKCHKEVHMKDGCRHYELRCK